MATKQCKQCKEIKPLTKEYFHSHPNTADKFFNQCKICYNKGRNVYNGTSAHRQSQQRTFNKLGGGIYEITNLITGDSYIGSTKHLQRRKYNHWTSCSKNTSHTSDILHNDFVTYSPDAFEFFILERFNGTKEERELKEKQYIKKFQPTYNIKNK
jgi:hypothetical protein